MFCIVIKDPPLFGVIPTIDEFSKTDGFSRWVVVDPWLNVCGAANEYPSKAEDRLKRWGSSGKRILWQGQFHLPTGTYKQTLMNSKVRFKEYK